MLVHHTLHQYTPSFSMIRSRPVSSKADHPRMAKTMQQLQINRQPDKKSSRQMSERGVGGQRAEGETNSPRTPLSPLTNDATNGTRSATSQVGDSTVRKDTRVESRDLLEPKFGDSEGRGPSMSSTSMPPLEDVPAIESKRIAPNQLYPNVQDFLDAITAGIHVERTSKIDNHATMTAAENTERRAARRRSEEDVPALPTMTTLSGRSTGGGRESCDHTVRFADSSGLDPGQETRATGSRPPKRKTRSEQPSKSPRPQPPQQQGTLIWPFRRNKANAEAARKMRNASSQPQPKSKPSTKIATSPMTDLIDTELLAAMDRKISWGKAKAYPGSVTLSELNDDGTGTSKTRSLRRIKKRKPVEEPPPKPRFEGMSLLRSILGIASASPKKPASPPQPQVKSVSKRARQPDPSSRQPSEKDPVASGSKATKTQKRKEASSKGEGSSAKAPDPPRSEDPEARRTVDSGVDSRAAETTEARHHSAKAGSPDSQASGSPESEATVPCTAVVPADDGTVAVGSN